MEREGTQNLQRDRSSREGQTPGALTGQQGQTGWFPKEDLGEL